MSQEFSTDAERVADQLHSVAIHLLRRLRREDAAGGLNGPRLSALSVIVFGGPVTLGELAAAEQVRPPTMTRIVNTLEEQGLVVKQKSAEDGRSTNLSATAAGRRLLIEGRERRVRALAAQIAALDTEDRATLQAAAAILEGVVRAV